MILLFAELIVNLLPAYSLASLLFKFQAGAVLPEALSNVAVMPSTVTSVIGCVSVYKPLKSRVIPSVSTCASVTVMSKVILPALKVASSFQETVITAEPSLSAVRVVPSTDTTSGSSELIVKVGPLVVMSVVSPTSSSVAPMVMVGLIFSDVPSS